MKISATLLAKKYKENILWNFWNVLFLNSEHCHVLGKGNLWFCTYPVELLSNMFFEPVHLEIMSWELEHFQNVLKCSQLFLIQFRTFWNVPMRRNIFLQVLFLSTNEAQKV